MNAYFSLFFPVGHSHAVAAKPGFITTNIGKYSTYYRYLPVLRTTEPPLFWWLWLRRNLNNLRIYYENFSY